MNALTDPNAALQALLQSGQDGSRFPPNSRYYASEVAVWVRPDQAPVVYLRRRFIPPPERYALLHEHTVVQGERLDHLAARYLGDPEAFWRICDANAVLDPSALEEPGEIVRITLPDGFAGATR